MHIINHNAMEYNLTDEQKKDVQTRSEGFRKEYQAIIEKYQVDFMCIPEYLPTRQGFLTGISMQVFDKKYLPIESPIQKEQIIKS